MYQQFYAALESPSLPLFALGFFISLFIAVTLRTFVFKGQGDFQAAAEMPLFDGSPVSKHEVKP